MFGYKPHLSAIYGISSHHSTFGRVIPNTKSSVRPFPAITHHHWYYRRDLSFMDLFLGHVTWRRPLLLPTRHLGSHWRQRRLQIPHWTRVTPTQAAAGWTAHQQQPLLIPFLWVTVKLHHIVKSAKKTWNSPLTGGRHHKVFRTGSFAIGKSWQDSV